MVDPRAVSGGISEALVATASGLVVALLALFPYMAFGAMRENTLGRLESLISVAQMAFGRTGAAVDTPRPAPATNKVPVEVA
jgi:biopolymer transport protein ExbB/TolQ